MSKATPAHQELQNVLEELRIRIEDITIVLAGVLNGEDRCEIYDNCIGRIRFRAEQITKKRQAYNRAHLMMSELQTLVENNPEVAKMVGEKRK